MSHLPPRGFLLSLLGAAMLSVGCDSKQSPVSITAEGPKAVVRVVKAQARTRVETDEVVGTVRARVRASVEAKVLGRIEWLNLTPGQAVKAGDVLARLDTREVSARLEQARVQLEQAERELKRFTTLVQQNAVTRQEYDVAESRARSARAAVTEVETWLGVRPAVGTLRWGRHSQMGSRSEIWPCRERHWQRWKIPGRCAWRRMFPRHWWAGSNLEHPFRYGFPAWARI
jgi:hypothetical protein